MNCNCLHPKPGGCSACNPPFFGGGMLGPPIGPQQFDHHEAWKAERKRDHRCICDTCYAATLAGRDA